jgi:hypothetical protein
MGLDVLLAANNQAVLDAGDYEPAHHRLSRTFGLLLDRRYESSGVSELEQIGQLTGLDIAPLYAMAEYLLPEDEQALLEAEEEEAAHLALQQRFATAAAARAGNLARVTDLVHALLHQVVQLEDLPAQLLPAAPDTLHNASYFAHFSAPTHNGYENSFGQDLRNFQHFLTYAKSKGSETIFFVFG